MAQQLEAQVTWCPTRYISRERNPEAARGRDGSSGNVRRWWFLRFELPVPLAVKRGQADLPCPVVGAGRGSMTVFRFVPIAEMLGFTYARARLVQAYNGAARRWIDGPFRGHRHAMELDLAGGTGWKYRVYFSQPIDYK